MDMTQTEQRYLPPAYATAEAHDPAARAVVEQQVAAMWTARDGAMQAGADETGGARTAPDERSDRTRHVSSV